MATVTGIFLQPNGESAERATFIPLDAPLVDVPSLVVAEDVPVLCDETGEFEVDLAAGRYRVLVLRSKPFYIQVPGGPGTYQLLDILTTVLPAAEDYTWQGGGAINLATPTIPGIVLLSSASATARVLTVEDGMPKAGADSNVRYNSANQLQFWNHTTAKWHTLMAFGPDGSVQSQWGPGED